MSTSAPEAVAAGRDAALAAFAQQTLGCNCPAEVFGRIELRHVDGRRVAVTIGERLLIHLLRLSAADDVGIELPGWVRDGLAERDRRGLNRFRLVLGSADPEGLSAIAGPLFAALIDGDDRAHLHCPEATALAALPLDPCT